MRAEALYRLGRDEEALRLLDDADTEMEARAEGLIAPDIPRIRGRLLARRGDRVAAEQSFRQSIERARAQQAWALEVRAAVDLHGLLCDDGRADEGRQAVAGSLVHVSDGCGRPELAHAIEIVGRS